jgi:amidase
MGHHWEGLYPVGFAEALGESRRSGSDHLPPAAKLLMLTGSYVSDRYHGRPYAIAQNLRRPLRASYDRALEQFDILAMPTTPMKAHRYVPDIGVEGLLEHGFSMGENTAPFNMTGHPAISIPCAKSAGLPVGLMLVGKRFDDATILTAASAFEQQVDWETHP